METFSNSVFTNSALAPVCSRSSTRAPISSASMAIDVGIKRLGDQAGKRLVGDHEPVDADAVVLRGDVGMAKWGCGFHGFAVARYA